MNETEQALSTPYADRLVVLDLMCCAERDVSLPECSPAAKQRFNLQIGECLTISPWNAQTESDVESQREVQVWKLRL